MTSPHRIVVPDSLAPPVGFAHALVPAPGRTVYLGGQAALDGAGKIVPGGIAEQFDRAAGNVAAALGAAGARPEHLVSMHIYVTDVAGYRAASKDLAGIYRRHFGRHYPAIALFGVGELFDPAALVELVCTAVIPD